MAYANHYTLPFKTLEGVACRFDILEKDYSGDILTMAGGGRSPVVHSWDANGIFDAVRGSKCVVQYLAKTKVIPAGGGMTIVEEEVISGWNYTVKFGGVTSTGVFSISLAAVNGSNEVFNVNVVAGQTLQSAVDAMQGVIQASTNFIALPTDTGIGLQIFESTLSNFTVTTTTLPPANTTPVKVPELPIENFLTTDETKFKGEFYLNDILQFTGYMVIDDFSAPYLTPPTIPTLTFTDGLALLDQVTLSDAGFDVTSGRIAIKEIIEKVLLLTNLDLPVREYYNLFPEGEPNRDDDPGIDPLSLQYLGIKSFLQNDDDFDNCQLVLEKILKANCSVLMQQQGVWTIVRVTEYKRFAGNIPGNTKGITTFIGTIGYISGIGGNTIFGITGGAAWGEGLEVGDTFSISDASNPVFNQQYTITAVAYDAPDMAITVAVQPAGGGSGSIDVTLSRIGDVVAPELLIKTIGKAGELIPTERSQNKAYSRPTKKVTNTYNYRIPQLLTNSNLQRLGELIGSSTDGDNTLTDYELSDWVNQNDGIAFIRVVTDTLTGKELDRFIYMPKVDGGADPVDPVGVLGVPIEVSAGDRFSFSYAAAAAPINIDSNAALRAGFLFVGLDGHKYRLVYNIPGNPSTGKYKWFSPTIDTPTNIVASPDVFYINRGTDISEYQTFNVWHGDINDLGIPRFPADGILYICLFGFNAGVNVAQTDSKMKDFNFQYFTYINDSTQIIGQVHTASQNVITKNEIADEIFIDDAPKFNITGGIFKKDSGVFIRTTDWIKQSGETDIYRHGEINAVDELLLSSNWRTMFEGKFYGLCNPVDSFTIDHLDGLFVPYKLELDYRQNSCSASLQEVSKTSDPSFASILYKFRFLYK